MAYVFASIMVIFIIMLYIGILWIMIKFVFWLFEELNIPNPIVELYKVYKSKYME